MAATIYGGSVEFVTIGLLQGAFQPLYAFLLALVINGRQLFYSIAMIEKFRGLGWKKKPLVSGIVDESFAINYAVEPPQGVDRGWFMFFVTIICYVSWVAGATIGSLVGSTSLSEIKGIGFVMTALFIGIFVSNWQKEKSHGASILGLIITAVCLPLFGKDYFMLPSLMIVSAIYVIRWFTTKDKEALQ